MAGELDKEYEQYLARFDKEIGDAELGAFAKYNGQLIQKLGYEEFESLYKAYASAAYSYRASVERGDTINDLIVKRVRDHATKLVLKSPV
jgi:hypothetical protein